MLSRIDFMKRSPSLFTSLSLEKAKDTKFFGSFLFFNKAFEWAKCAGSIINASIKEINRVNITTTDNSPKNSPILPSKNKKSENAKIVVIIAETTGGSTSRTPSIAAR